MNMAANSRILRSSTRLQTGRAAQIGWLLFTLFALSLALPGVAPYTELLQTICHGSPCLIGQLTAADARAVLASGDSLAGYALFVITIYLFTYLIVLVTAISLIWRKPTHAGAVCGAFVLTALATSPLAQAAAQSMPILELPVRLIQLVHVAGLLPFFCLIPDGRFRSIWLGWATLAVVPLGVLMVFDALTLTTRTLLALLIGTLIVTHLIYRYRSMPTSYEQEQLAWVLAVFALLAGAQLMGRPLRPLPLPVVPLDTLPPALASFFPVIGMLFVVGALTCLAVALLNDELFRVDVALNRALVYSLLTLFVVGGYVLIVGYLSLVLQSRGSVWFSLIATGLVAVLFQPIRDRVQRFVNQLLYGERDDPYNVIAHLGQRLAAAFDPSSIPATIAETVRDSLRLPYVAVELQHGDEAELVVASGTRVTEPVRFPLTYQGIIVGHLFVSPRRGDESLSTVDRALLVDLAHHAGVAIHAVRLMADLQRLSADLQRSREGLVLAREEERRRLRRDLHDDLAPTLAGLSLRAGTISELVHTDPVKAGVVADNLDLAIRNVVRTIRRLVYDLRPPALDELGLLPAIRERAAQWSSVPTSIPPLNVVVDAPDTLPVLPAAVEVAAYRIVQEALMNVVKHAQASMCLVRIVLTNTLIIDITDDGIGVVDNPPLGIGLRSMQERALELGGTCEIARNGERGTSVRVCLPITHEANI
jgi:signal transduction histidine kinase